MAQRILNKRGELIHHRLGHPVEHMERCAKLVLLVRRHDLHQHVDKDVQVMAKLLVLFSAGAVEGRRADADGPSEVDGELDERDNITQAAKGEGDFHGGRRRWLLVVALDKFEAAVSSQVQLDVHG